QVTRIANTPAFIKGVTNLRGVIVPIVDLRVKFCEGDVEYDDNDLSATSGQYLDVVGLSVTGDDNDVEIGGGINITHSEDPL
ncbi:chemotaxis protein CheW, partial [Salmonella enterica subsp. enterica serovar Virginia]|nr:chemotaxis protein CheW [Salmonella enterica subsp. enterica serovar Virginia]